MATFTKKSLGNSSSLWLVQKKNWPEKFPFIAANNWVVLAAQWSVKYFFCSEFFPPYSGKVVEKRRRRVAITKYSAFQANAIRKEHVLIKCLFNKVLSYLLYCKDMVKSLLHQRCSQSQKNTCSQMFHKIVVLKSFSRFTGKHLYWSHFLMKLQA